MNKQGRNSENACVGKGCSREGTIIAKIILLDKEALFCQSCKIELEKNGLISSESSEGQSICLDDYV